MRDCHIDLWHIERSGDHPCGLYGSWWVYFSFLLGLWGGFCRLCRDGHFFSGEYHSLRAKYHGWEEDMAVLEVGAFAGSRDHINCWSVGTLHWRYGWRGAQERCRECSTVFSRKRDVFFIQWVETKWCLWSILYKIKPRMLWGFYIYHRPLCIRAVLW